jgi:hypothetical protein
MQRLASYFLVVLQLTSTKCTSNPKSLAVIGGEWALDASQLAHPPVVGTLRLLDDTDTIALLEGQVAIALPCKVVQRRHELGLLAGDPRRRRWGFLFRGDGGLAVAVEVVGVRGGRGEGYTARGLVGWGGGGGGDEDGFGGGGVWREERCGGL